MNENPNTANATGEKAPLVSVVMPVYNGETYLAEAIESILTQTHSDLELIVIDDCSADGTAAIIRDYLNRDERVRLVRNDRNQGMPSARNSGIAVSRGEFIATMDCDDVSLPQRLEKQVAFLQANPDIGVVGLCLQNTAADLSERQFYSVPQQHVFMVLYWILGGTTLYGGVIMARRTPFLAVGGYNESCKLAEDTELLSRLCIETRVANLPEAPYLYRHHGQQVSASAERRERRRQENDTVRLRWLKRVSGESSAATLERFDRFYWSHRFGWREWWLLRRDIRRLIKGMGRAGVLDGRDLEIAAAEIRQRLEKAKPRRWQIFIHWRRHRLGF
ncbi:MAG: glycosyltransferase family 2 protein [Chloroflexota bacterium]|nr:glycosyltransferase family 2 protein [Chloroflexota bacterium]